MWQQQMLYIAVYTKVACGLACFSPGNQRGLGKWDQAGVEGGPCWVISLVGSGITSVALVGRLGFSGVSEESSCGWRVAFSSQQQLGGCNPICGALSD